MQKIAVLSTTLLKPGFSQQPATSSAEEQDTYSKYYFCACFWKNCLHFKIIFFLEFMKKIFSVQSLALSMFFHHGISLAKHLHPRLSVNACLIELKEASRVSPCCSTEQA